MARRSENNPGYSRRAQYGRFISYSIAVVGLGFGALLLAISAFYPNTGGPLRNLVNEVTAPFNEGTSAVGEGTKEGGNWVSSLFRAGSENARLRRTLKKVPSRLARFDAVERENKELKKLLGLSESQEDVVAKGRIIAGTPASTRRLALLSLGSRDGIENGMPIRGANGLVGRVLDTGFNNSRLLLVTDSDSVVPVKRARDGMPAIATGLADGTVMIRPLNVGVNPFRKGDRVVTSGSGGLYPPNVPFAQIVAKRDDGAVARPFADPSQTNFVLVLPIYEPAAQTLEEGGELDGAQEDASGSN